MKNEKFLNDSEGNSKLMKKILLALFIGLFLISSISALDFHYDNYKEFEDNSKYGVISIFDKGQIGQDKKLAQYTLLINTDQCLIDCYAEGKVIFYTKSKLFTDIQFKNKERESVNLNFSKIFIEVDEEYGVKTVDEELTIPVCGDFFDEILNETYYGCSLDAVYKTEIKTRKVWKEYNGKSLSPGEYKWKIEGKKSIRENIDWIGSAFGEDLTEWAWWNSTWVKKKKINITEQSNSTESNYSVKLNITYDSDMQTDFDDLRFVNGSEDVELDYWIESKVDSASAIVWVKVPILPANSTTYIYMYYNNSAVSTTSNINNSFRFYDDFEDNHISEYKIDGGTWDMDSAGNGLLRETGGAGNYNLILAHANFTNLKGFEIYTNFSSPTNAGQSWTAAGMTNYSQFLLTSQSTLSGAFQHHITFDRGDCIPSYTTANKYPSIIDDANYHIDTMRVFWINESYSNWTGIIDGAYRTSWEGESGVKTSQVTRDSPKKIKAGTDWNTLNIDFIRLRAYTYPEPTYSIGEEETDADVVYPNITINTPLNQTYSTITITFNVTAVDDTLMDSCWYSLNDGALNYSMTNLSSYYFDTNSSMNQGSHTIIYYCNDSSNNLNDTESVSFFIDSINPLIQTTYPTNITYNINISTLNYTYIETNCNYTWYSQNGGSTNSTLESCGTNFTNIVGIEGLNTWTIFINDTIGNSNQSSVSFTIDTTGPIITIQSPTNTTYTNPTIWFNATNDSIVDTWIINYNGTNITIVINTSLEIENGYFNMRFWANDSQDNWGLNDTIYFTVAVDDTPPYFITIPSNTSLIYNDYWSGVFFNASDNIAFDTYSINDSRFTINSTGYLINSSDLSYGNYLLNISINDTANNINWTIYHIEVNQSTENCQILFNETSPLVYPNIFLVMTDCTSNYEMKVNGSVISNNTIWNSGVGAYNFSVFRIDNFNYSNIYDDEEFQITQSTDSCQVYFNESSPLVYPDIFTTWTNCSSSYTLAINGSAISNNTIQILASSAYNFSVIRTDEINYSNIYDDEEFQISLGSLSGSITGTSPITYPTTGDIEGSESNYGDWDINYYLYRNGTNVNNPDNTILAYGYYSYIYNNTLGENYTSSASLDTFSLLINQNTSSCQVYFNETSPLIQPSIFITYTNCTSSYILEINSSPISNNSINILPVGSYNYSILRDDYYNYTNYYDDEYFIINIGTGEGNLSLNSSVNNRTIYRTDIILIEGELLVGTDNIYIYINDTLFDGGASPLSDTEVFNTISYYEINLTYLGNENYTSFGTFLYANVIANPFADISIIYPTSETYSFHITILNYTVINYTNCWYNLNEGDGNIAIICGTNITSITSVLDLNTWAIYVNNTDGVITSSLVTFRITLPYEYDDLTKNMIEVLQFLIVFAGLWIVLLSVKRLYEGDLTLGEVIIRSIIVSLGLIGLLFLGPILIKYLISVIK